MDRFPTEILALVANLLPLAALREFRLVSSRMADVAYPVLVQHLSVVNTAECLEEFKHFIYQNEEAARSTKKLTIYHGTWPACTQDGWETHPLLLGGCHRMDIGRQRSHAADQAYQDYRDFILREGSRKPSDLLVALHALPNLRSITLTHLRTSHLKHPQYSRLRKKIWLQPYMKDSVSPTVTRVLGALSDFCRVTEIEINGNFNPYDIEGPVRAEFIENLKITSLRCSDGRKLSQFLSSFSRIRELSLEMHDIITSTEIPLDQVLWPKLEVVELANGRVSKRAMVTFIQRHASLSVLRARRTAMIGGSWESVLHGIQLKPTAGLEATRTTAAHTSRFSDASSLELEWVRSCMHPILGTTASSPQVLGPSS
ncbi:hypothetical protein F4824DRAFT_512991 [Ustulina deusta]|nr:hypothetical protein F4824DRAFT_512991 [Ustulina deusta]